MVRIDVPWIWSFRKVTEWKKENLSCCLITLRFYVTWSCWKVHNVKCSTEISLFLVISGLKGIWMYVLVRIPDPGIIVLLLEPVQSRPWVYVQKRLHPKTITPELYLYIAANFHITRKREAFVITHKLIVKNFPTLPRIKPVRSLLT